MTVSFLIQAFVKKNESLPWDQKKAALFLANKRDLVGQASRKLTEFGIEHGVIMAGEEEELWHSVQVASVQTLIRRIAKDPMYMKSYALIVADECHGSICPTFKAIFDMFQDACLIGLTATPCGPSGRGLDEVYQDLYQAISIRELVDLKCLVPVTYYVPNVFDLSKLTVQEGKDYTKEQRGKIDKKISNPKLVGNILSQWLRLASDRQTIIYCNSISHSRAVAHLFCLHGINAEHIDGNTPADERMAIRNRFEDMKTQVVTNCEVWTEGVDLPICSCIVIARPTKSLRLWHQMIGRGMRPYEGKVDMLCIDHTGAFYDLFPVDIDIHWSLKGKEIAYQQNKQQRKEAKLIQCKECQRVFSGTLKCPDCGWMAKSNGKPVEYIPAELEKAKQPKEKYTMDQKQSFYSMALGYCTNKGYSEGWASHKYRDKFGVWPRGLMRIAVQPDKEFLSYVKYINIRRAKANERRSNGIDSVR